MQNDNIKMYEPVKKIKRLRPPQKLLIKGKNSLTTNPAEQGKITAEYFKETFYKNKQPRTIIPPTQMTILFTANEIRKAIAKMKPNKTPGCEKTPVELIKYAPDRIHEQIAKIYKNMAETGDIPKEVTYGILKSLQKPNKAKSPPSNLRPIILLYSLRKILAACITNKIKDRLEAEIPPSQAAYRPSRSATEYVFTSKLIIERTITARNESAYLIMMDMSKAFDSINRNQLIEDLRNTIETDEHHLNTSQCFTLCKM